MIKTRTHQIVNQATIKQSIREYTARHTQPPVGPVTRLTYISRDAQGHLANLNAGPLALRTRLYHHPIAISEQPCSMGLRGRIAFFFFFQALRAWAAPCR